MACEVCQHCDTSIEPDVCVIHNGLSYHKRCRHCYVCGETDLRNGETFRGVIFCSACSKRIFQGCSTARQAKSLKTRSPRRRRRRDRVLERTVGARGSPSGSCNSCRSIRNDTYSAVKIPDSKVTEGDDLKKYSAERGTSTYVTQETLKGVTDHKVDRTILPAPVKPRKKRKTHKHYQNKNECSDLRIAELGASVELAHMALRKQSEVPVIIKSEVQLKRNETRSLTTLKQESAIGLSRFIRYSLERIHTNRQTVNGASIFDLSEDSSKWRESMYSSEGDSKRTPWMQRSIRSILKIPLRSFKRNILDRSSMISVYYSNETYNSLQGKLRRSMNEEIIEHQRNGLKQLYSTINRKNKPCKLGWLHLVSQMSKDPRTRHEPQCNKSRRCKHFETSHSYRCMRDRVMRLAGPTRSELAVIRGKIFNVVSPTLIKNIISYNKKYAAILTTQAYRR